MAKLLLIPGPSPVLPAHPGEPGRADRLARRPGDGRGPDAPRSPT